MAGEIQFADSTNEFTVIELIPGVTGAVDAVYASPSDSDDDDVYKLAVVAGVWQVIGVLKEHIIVFFE